MNENATEEPDSKKSAADGDTKKTLMEEEKDVVKIPPIANCNWYLGSGDSPFYLRQCVMDVGKIILSHITDKKNADQEVQSCMSSVVLPELARAGPSMRL